MKHTGRILLAAASCVVMAACAGPAGENGKPCSVKDNGNGTATITCADGTTIDVKSGTSGTPGTNGTNGSDGTNGTNGTAGTNGTNGVNGTSCTLVVNPDAGSKTITCTDGTSATLLDGVDANSFVDFALMTPLELAQDDFTVSIQSVSNAAKPVVKFTVKNNKLKGVKNIGFAHIGGVALLQLVPGSTAVGGNGLALDTWVSHMANCATCTASSENATATNLVDNGNGTYTYTFLKDVVTPIAVGDGGMTVAGVAFDANAVHRFGMRFGFSGNPYRPVDATYDYVPATGVNVDGQNDKVNTSNCLSCHNQWRANVKNLQGATPFHSGQRYDVRYCVVCHNDQRKYSGSSVGGNALLAEPGIDTVLGTVDAGAGKSVSFMRGEAIINLPVFAHKIHNGEHLTLKGNYAGLGTEINEFSFPQDIRNCTKCHSNAAKANNWQVASRRACGACHDNVDYATRHPSGVGGAARTNDNACITCHPSDAIVDAHRPIAPIDPTNTYSGGTNGNTNASLIGNVLNPPAGARIFQYDLNSVTATAAATPTDGGVATRSPVVKFRFLESDAGVAAFNVADGGNNLFDGFVGSPSVYCVWTMPQDGLATPADFNMSGSVYLKNAWNGSATTGASAATFTGPDSSGYYTVTLTGALLHPSATQLTCGLGYTYALASTQPLTQTNVADPSGLGKFNYNTTTKVGGISFPAKNVWRVATGFTGRRGASNSGSATGQIVQTSKCAECHNQLGVSPTYHSGQRNDAATCSFCHTQNRTSSGWTAGSESFIHAIHAAQKRTVPFNWHAVATVNGEGQTVLAGFAGIEYPGRLNYCESCHQAGYYDFSASWYTANGGANLNNRLVQTVATGAYGISPIAPPYIISDGGVNYGNGYGLPTGATVNTPNILPVEAAGTTLVISPVANTCFGCHDSAPSKLHMQSNGATIYGARNAQSVEQCMICHGPGKTAAIKDVHYQ